MLRFAFAIGCVGCTQGQPRSAPPSAPATSPPSASEATASPAPLPPAPAPAPIPLSPVWLYQGGARRVVDAADAAAQGYTIVDLSDGWVPFVLREADYRETFLGLAQNRIDAELDDLMEGKDNTLELFGIPPTLTVLRARFFADVDRPCAASIDLAAIARLDRDLFYTSNTAGKKRLDEYLRLERQVARGHAPAAVLERHDARKREIDALDAVQKRLACEQFFPGRGFFRPRVYDWSTHIAVGLFERRNMVFGWGFMTEDTRAALAKPPLVLAHEALVRVVRERVVDAAAILEDGSVKERGNLVDEATRVAILALGVETPEKLRAFWDAHSDFAELRAAVKLPPPPDYYAADMDLEVSIDRGDVWYELPFRDDGSEKPQPRERTPHLTLFVNKDGRKIPLIRWRTTIGNWRSEWKDGQEFWKYKNSDVGWRVWRHIVAAPVWIPPDTTPPRSLLKKVKVKVGHTWEQQIVPDLDGLGPGYASAYGLAMAMHVVESKRKDGTISTWDNQIRTHGSVDYNSILRRYSHGCHRLHNHLAVRLFGFVLRHRPSRSVGQSRLVWNKAFEWEGVPYEIKLRTRGYTYELTQPIPVYVDESTIKGDVKKPIEEYVPKIVPPGETPPAAPADTAASPMSPSPSVP